MPNSTGYHSHLWVFNDLFPFFKTQLSVMMVKSFLFSGWCMVKETGWGMQIKAKQCFATFFCLRSLIHWLTMCVNNLDMQTEK